MSESIDVEITPETEDQKRSGSRSDEAVEAIVPVERAPLHDGERRSILPMAKARRPPSGWRRFMRAYFVTFQVIWSYLWVRFWGRFFGPEWLGKRLEKAHIRNARRAERTILKLQGLFIKAGQVISIMTNFLPEEFRVGLEALQDSVPPRPLDEIEKRFVEEFGKKPEQLFDEFDPEPIASASIAQVHVARLHSGEKVAVKVQHYGLEQLVEADMATIRGILTIVQFFFPVRGLDAMYDELREMIEHEMDFTEEARSIVRISKNFVDNDRVRFPRIHPEVSTGRVLTSEFMEGCKIGDIEAIEAMGVDRAELARHVVTTYCQMIFVDGEYHADPHPGNLLVQPDGTVVFLDFGAVAKLSPGMRKGIIDLMMGVIKRDTEKIVTALRTMGFLTDSSSSEEVSEKVIEHFHRRFQEEIHLESFNLKDLKFDPQMGIEGLIDLSRMDVGIRELTSAFHIPKEWVLLERTALLLTGVCSLLDPQMNPTEVERPYLEEFVLGKDRDWTEVLLEATKDTVLSYLALPAEIRRFLSKASRGEVSFKLRGMRRGFLLLYALGHQLIFTSLGITSAVGAYMFYRDGEEIIALGCLVAAGWFSFLTMLSMVMSYRHVPRH